jgi:hypothetical protein
MKENQANERREVLVGVLSDVLEKLAFMFGEETPPEELPPSESGYMQARMAFSGPIKGRLALAVSDEMCPEIAANILGVEPFDERVMEKAQDALKELLNITCGQTLTALAGDEPVFDLSVPEASPMDAEAWNELIARPGAATMLADEYPVVLHLEMDET